MPKKSSTTGFNENKHLSQYDKYDPKQHYKSIDDYIDYIEKDIDQEEYDSYLYRYKRSKSEEKKLTKEEYLKLFREYEELKNKVPQKGFPSSTYTKLEKMIRLLCLV